VATKSLDLVSREEAERRLKAEEAAAAEKAERLKRGPDIRSESCCDCGAFGPWCDGEFNYCKEHVPHSLRYLGKTREEEARRT
jgi:hypothetical protein